MLTALAGGIYIYVTASAADKYFQQTRQQLNKSVAYELINAVNVFSEDTLNTKAVQKIMMHHMKVNPTAEVYILDQDGMILTFDAPEDKILLNKVEVAPVREFIASQGNLFVLGEDPRNPGVFKVFSAAPIYNKREVLKGYVYVILSSEEFDSVSSMLWSNFLFKVGIKAIALALLFALVIGLIAIWFITRNLKKTQIGIQEFSNGNYSHRIEVSGKDEFADLANTFNKMATELESNIAEIESVEKLRKELIANVSHDLRTPIAVLYGYLETILMKKDTISPEQLEKYLNTAIHSAEKLEKLVKDLFELTKLESSKIDLNLQEVNPCELMKDLHSRCQVLADQKNISIELEGEENHRVEMDYSLMERALQNLIENAIKFTEEKGCIALNVHSDDSNVFLVVKDSGVGISQEALPHVFNRYKKVQDGKSDDTGIGLGLAIVRRVVELHNFEIKVNSVKGQGTSFTIVLPRS